MQQTQNYLKLLLSIINSDGESASACLNHRIFWVFPGLDISNVCLLGPLALWEKDLGIPLSLADLFHAPNYELVTT